MTEPILVHGDCLDKMKWIEDKSIDMILTDLPYGVTARNKWDSILPIERENYIGIFIFQGTIVNVSIIQLTESEVSV